MDKNIIKETMLSLEGADQRDDLHDVRIRVAGIADGFQIGITDLAAGLNDFARKLDGSVPLRVAHRITATCQEPMPSPDFRRR